MIHIEELADMLDTIDEYTDIYYDPMNDTYITVSDFDDRDDYDDLELERMYRLPDKRELDDYGVMVRFIEQLDDEEAAEWLANAIRGRGAFRMFRATAERFHLTSEWYAFRDRARRQAAVRWCEEYGLMYDYETVEEDEQDDVFDDDEWIHGEKKELPKPKKPEPENNIRIVDVTKKNSAAVQYMMDAFKKEYSGACRDTEERLRLYMSDFEKYHVTAAMEQGKALGYLAAEKTEDALILREIYVRPNDRRNGIGRGLLEDCEDTADDAGLPLTVTMDPQNPVMFRFLKACGYGTLAAVTVVRDRDDSRRSFKLNDQTFRG